MSADLYPLHPLCTLFPRMTGADFDALRDDIKANGLRSPITLHNGMILDGGNRYRACVEAGARVEFVEFRGENLVAFVMSANLHRRHMTQGQQAAIVASAQDWAKAQPAGRPTQQEPRNVAGLPEEPRNVAVLSTAADRAAQSGASLRTQQMADKVAKADPALALQVAHGEVTLPAAVAAVSHPKVDAVEPPAPAPKPAPVKAEAPPADPEPSEVEALREQVAAMAQELEEVIDDNRSMAAVFDANDKLATAMAENKKLRAQVSQLTERVAGLMNEKNAAIRAAKAAQKKLAQMGVAA